MLTNVIVNFSSHIHENIKDGKFTYIFTKKQKKASLLIKCCYKKICLILASVFQSFIPNKMNFLSISFQTLFAALKNKYENKLTTT